MKKARDGSYMITDKGTERAQLSMAKDEHPEKHSWWLNELESLGINTKEEGQFRDFQKTTELTTDIKQMFYEEYKSAFSEGQRLRRKLIL